MVTIDLCGNLMFFLVVAGLGRGYTTILRAQCTYAVRAIHKGKHKYLHAYKQNKPSYAKFVVCKLWPHFVYFSRIFAKQLAFFFSGSIALSLSLSLSLSLRLFRFICVFVLLSF